MQRLPLLVAATVALVASCSGGVPPSSPASPGASGGRSLDLHVENGTSKDVTILVDGVEVSTVAAGQSATIAESDLPGGVWSVSATLPGGRTVLSAEVDRSVVSQTVSSASGSGGRVDLSCGRLDVWVGVPMIGPAPGPGTPGDCDG